MGSKSRFQGLAFNRFSNRLDCAKCWFRQQVRIRWLIAVGSLIVRLCIPLASFVWAVFAVCQLGDAAGD